MTELLLAGCAGALLATTLWLVALVVFVHKAHATTQAFLQGQAIDERNERFHEVRSLLMRLQSSPSLSLERAAPEIRPIEDPQPYISDYEMDDDRWEAFVEQTRPQNYTDTSFGPAPVVDSSEDD